MREKERERNIDVYDTSVGCLSRAPNQGPGPHNPGMCPDWESNLQPFGPQASTQSTEPHQPGHFYLNIYFIILKVSHLNHSCNWNTDVPGNGNRNLGPPENGRSWVARVKKRLSSPTHSLDR